MSRFVFHLFISAVLSMTLAASAVVALTPDEGEKETPSKEAKEAKEAEEAEEAAPEEVTRDEIVVVGKYLYTDQVKALRTPTPIIDVPQSLSITTADQLSQQGFTSIGDIVDYTPGVSTSQGEGHRDAIVFRGVRSTADFFIDGVRDDVQYYRPLYNL